MPVLKSPFRRLPLLALATALTPLPAFAQTPTFAQTSDDPATGDTDPIIVTATRTPQPIDEVNASVTLIDKAEIDRRQSNAVQDLLRTVPGVTVTRNGALGGTASINIRGAETDQTVILIDGVKLNDPSSTGGGYFGTLLTAGIDRIEIVRGSQSVIWGSQAIGGVINLITRDPRDGRIIAGHAEGGNPGHVDVGGTAGDTFGPLAISAGVNWLRSDGVSAYDRDLGGEERDGFRQLLANGKAVLTLSDALSIDLRGRYSASHADIDGFAPPNFAFGDTAEYAENNESVGYAGVNLALFDGRLKNRAGVAYTRIDRDLFDPAQAPFDRYVDSTGINRRYEYQGTLDLDAVGAVFGAEREVSSFRDVSFGAVTPRRRASIDSVYGELSYHGPGASLSGGIRHDSHSRFGSVTTFAASGGVTPNDGLTRLRASFGEGFKVPSLYQLFGDFGNTLLNPERSTSYDVGVVQRTRDGSAEASITWFHRITRNQIDFVGCFGSTDPICDNRPFGVYDNVRRTRAQGIEAALTLKPTEGLIVTGQYSFIDAEDRDTGNRLARRPRQTVSALVDYRWRFGLSTGATVAHVGDSFDNAANSVPLDGYVLVDLRAALPVTSSIEVYGRIENLFDEQYETIFQYGTPRRAAYGGVRLKL